MIEDGKLMPSRETLSGRVRLAVVAVLLVGLHVGLSWWYGLFLPWGGDEWYTYEGRTLMAVPNTILIECARLVLGGVNPGNYMFYRLTGVVWVSFAVAGLFLLGRDNRDFRMLLPMAVFLVFSPFVFFQEQYFRYYGFYLGASFGVFILIRYLDYEYRKCRLVFWGLLLLSPFLYLFLGLQIGCYVAFREWSCLKARGRILVASSAILVALVLITFWSWFIRFGMEIAFTGMSSVAGENAFRGFSPGLAIKPFYFVFETFWGYQVEPTENWLVILGSVWLFSLLAFRFSQLLLKDRERAGLVAACLLVPLAAIYLVLEPMTPPGATQLESKHALFGLPWLLLLVFDARGRLGKWLAGVTVFGILGIALVHTFRRPGPLWPEIADVAASVVESGGRVVVDGRSNRTFRFYASDRIDPDSVSVIGDFDSLEDGSLDPTAEIMVIQNDWKAYQVLSLEQNWNSGSDSSSKVQAVTETISFLKEGGYVGKWGAVQFPLQAFVYAPKAGSKAPIPSVLPIAYRDLSFPREIGGTRFLGAANLRPGDQVVLGRRNEGLIVVDWFLKGAENLPKGTTFGTIQLGDLIMPLKVGPEVSSRYQMALCRGLEGSRPIDSWNKRPLISQASRYPESFFSAEGVICQSVFEGHDSITISVSHPSIELIILVPESDS
ncbi:MAG: hypothetical protein R3F07_04495 [Opitutaceae bacterium]